MKIPFINKYNELVIPFEAARKYHYWSGGMCILETLKEIGASREIINKYKGGC